LASEAFSPLRDFQRDQAASMIIALMLWTELGGFTISIALRSQVAEGPGATRSAHTRYREDCRRPDRAFAGRKKKP